MKAQLFNASATPQSIEIQPVSNGFIVSLPSPGGTLNKAFENMIDKITSIAEGNPADELISRIKKANDENVSELESMRDSNVFVFGCMEEVLAFLAKRYCA